MTTPKGGFVPLSTLKAPTRPAAEILADIRTIYFRTSEKTIAQDFDHAIALLLSLDDEGDRDKAAVYMEGLNEMRSEWAKSARPARVSTASTSKPGRAGQSPTRSASNTSRTGRPGPPAGKKAR